MAPSARLLPPLLLALLLTIACANEGPTSALPNDAAVRSDAAATPSNVLANRESDDDGDDDGHLLRCTPLVADSAAAWIGPTGGTLAVGPHRFEVPAGALAEPVRITARIQPDSLVAVKFGPSGLQFATPARLHLATGQCATLPSTSLAIAHVNDAGTQVIEVLSSNEEVGGIWAEIAHFTRYAIAY